MDENAEQSEVEDTEYFDMIIKGIRSAIEAFTSGKKLEFDSIET